MKEISTLEEFKGHLKEVLQEDSSKSLENTLKAQLLVIQYIESPKLIDSSFDLLFANLRKAVKYSSDSVERDDIQEKAQLMIHNYIFFLQAKLDYMYDNQRKATREILEQATEKVIEGAMESIKQVNPALPVPVNIAIVAKQIVGKFDRNFIQKIWGLIFGICEAERKNRELMETLSLLFDKFVRYKHVIGKSDIIPGIIYRYGSAVVWYRNKEMLQPFYKETIVAYIFRIWVIWGIIFGLLYYMSSYYIDYRVFENKRVIYTIGGLGMLMPLYKYIFVKLKMFLENMKYKRLANSFYPN